VRRDHPPGVRQEGTPFDAATAVLDAAIGELCERLRPASVVLVGHSIGGAIEALVLDLLEIQKLTPDHKSPEPGDRRSP
jgi:alpha-beta hydrolase superfamily lysophospholipase